MVLTEGFQAMVLEYATIYDERAKYRKIMSELNKRQKVLQQKVEQVMLENDVERLDTGDGTVSISTRSKTTPINRNTIKEILLTWEGLEGLVSNRETFLDSLVDYLYESRKVEETVTLKRTKKREK